MTAPCRPNRSCVSTLFFFVCLLITGAALAQEVIPDFYSEPGIHPNRALINGGPAESIDPFTGSLQWHFTDLHLPGNGGFDLKVIRSYNGSTVNISNLFGNVPVAGLGWSIHFGRVMKARENTICNNKDALTVADNPVLELPDGSRQLLAFTGVQSPLMLTQQRWRADCILTGSSGLSVMSPDGLRYDMTQLVNVGTGVSPMFAWYATRITDRNGNFAVINYAAAASPEVTSITTSDGRSISFTYADPGTASRRVTSITASGGQTYSYSYQPVAGTMGLFHLTGVRRPDGSSWTFSYNGNWGASPGSYLLSRVTYPQGGTIDYGYGFVSFDAQANPSFRSTVVTTRTQSPGGTWTYAYAPGGPGVHDTTTVTAPSGVTTYRHIGPNFVSNGSVWMVGLLVSKSVGALETQTYTWGKQKIGNENYFRPGRFVRKVDAGETNAPVLLQRTLVRGGATYSVSMSNHDGYGKPARGDQYHACGVGRRQRGV